MTGPRTTRRAVLAGVILALGLVAPACGSAPASTPPAATPVSAPASATSSPSTSAQPAGGDDGPKPLPTSHVRVTSLRIDSIGLRTTNLEKLALLPDATLAAPKDPDRAGWYVDGAVPGEVGPAVIAGHVDSTTGPAVFARLGETAPGSTIVVGLSDGTRVTFRVDKTVHTAKRSFPTREVYGPTPDAQLRLITCSGSYDRSRGYLDNTVVLATLASSSSAG